MSPAAAGTSPYPSARIFDVRLRSTDVLMQVAQLATTAELARALSERLVQPSRDLVVLAMRYVAQKRFPAADPPPPLPYRADDGAYMLNLAEALLMHAPREEAAGADAREFWTQVGAAATTLREREII
ncbi:MAG: hypothetical protein ACXVHB_33325 [Solirubrobacteraceae bacterium]